MVLNFLQKFHDQSLLLNVNLEFSYFLSKESLHRTLAQILPLIGDHIHSIRIRDIEELEHSHEMMTTLMARTNIVSIKYE
jgi:hypothetical protein